MSDEEGKDIGYNNCKNLKIILHSQINQADFEVWGFS